MILENALVLKDRSEEVYWHAIKQARLVNSLGKGIYPPNHLPNIRHSESGSTIRSYPDSELDGELKVNEAVALLVLVAETKALAQSFGRGFEVADKINQALNLPNGSWQSDAIDGLAEFGSYLSLAAGVRQAMVNGNEPKQIRTIGDSLKRYWWDCFADAVTKDELELGENTAVATVGVVQKFAFRDIPNNREGARTEEEVNVRILSRIHGARLAAKLYLEVANRAKEDVSRSVDLTTRTY